MQQEFIVPEKSPNDDREYQAIELPNKLRILFISDPKAQKAACAVAVGVGSLRDGQRSLGLAHFLEHMLFMGSRKFPKHNEYSQFMSLNSGFDNAYTSDEYTNYHFQISTSKFSQAVERLCDFFVQALLTSSCIQKQRQAVHQECMLRFSEDNSRKWQILKHFASGPYHNHSIGNNNTLSHEKVQEDLREFYKKEYSANRITAVLLSAMSIEDMKKDLKPFFEEIQNKNLDKPEYVTHFEKEKIGKFVRMQSIKDQTLMQFFWAVESVRPHYQWHPETYITHVIGHQGKNSLLSILKAKDWASQIVSYNHDLPQQTIFGLQVHLTQKGEKQYKNVYNLIVDYVTSLKAEKHVYDEIAEASAVAFKFKEKGSNFDYATRLADTLHKKPMNEVLSWKAHYKQFNAELIDRFLQQLRPQNVIVVYSCVNQLKNPITEKHLGGKFVIEELPVHKNSGQKFESLIKNPFLPLKTDLVPGGDRVPKKEGNVWYVQGDFGVCKGGVHLKVCKAESQIFLEFLVQYLDLLLKEITYQAESLRLEVHLQAEYQLTIKIYGFSHTIQKLLQQIAPLITSAHKGKTGEKLFKLAHEALVEEYDNFYEGEVDETVDQLLKIVLKSTGTTVEQRIEELKKYKYKGVSKRIQEFWISAKLQWVVVGNFCQENILNKIKEFEEAVGTDSSADKLTCSCLKLNKQKQSLNIHYLESQDIGTSAVIMYKDIGQYNELKYYTLSLLKNYIETPFFDKLRTEQQLAYYLAAYQQNIRGALALCFMLISSNANPKEVSGHISAFISNFIEKIEEDLTQQKFEQLKTSLKSKTLAPFESLNAYFQFIERQISKGTFCFDRKTNAEQLNGYLSQIKREDLIKMLKECLDYNLEVWVVSQPHRAGFEENKVQGESVQEIKKKYEYYSDKSVQKQKKEG